MQKNNYYKKININFESFYNLKKFILYLRQETNLNSFIKKMKKNTALCNWEKSYFTIVLSRN